MTKSMEKSQDVFYLAPDKAVLNSSDESSVSQALNATIRQNVQEEKLPDFSDTPLLPDWDCESLSKLRKHLNRLAGLIANMTEAYSVSLFLADQSTRTLHVGGVHTLSRNFLYDSKISFGSGLVGWTAENAVRISVCPFENDATTLLYYSQDQDLKSFIAVPILDENKRLLGVISCDSKKSYAFAKITEKILLDCASQAAAIINLVHAQGSPSKNARIPEKNRLSQVLDHLREIEDENELLSVAADLPTDLVKRDALVVMTTAEGGVGDGEFYSTSTESRIEHRLLELVCRHKKIICGERSVHALPVDDSKQRSFLSVPIHVLGRESGSLNLLSKPHGAFSAEEISALEKVAKALGQCLERIRLRDKLAGTPETNGLLSWKHFVLKGKIRLLEAKKRKTSLSLLRLSFNNIIDVEKFAGVDASSAAISKLTRLVEQVARPPSLLCRLYDNQILLLTDSSEAERVLLRFRRLLEKLSINDLVKGYEHPQVNVGEMLNQGLEIASASYPRNGATVAELTAKTRSLLEAASFRQPIGEVANAGNW